MLIACLIPAVIFGIVAIIALFRRYGDYKGYRSYYYRLDHGAPIRMRWQTWKCLYRADPEQWRLIIDRNEPRCIWNNPETGRQYGVAFPSYLEFLLAIAFIRRYERKETKASDKIDVARELEFINEIRTSLSQRAEREQHNKHGELQGGE